MWIAVLEDHEGMWSDDPIGADTRDEAEKIALTKWPKVEVGERRASALFVCQECRSVGMSKLGRGIVTSLHVGIKQ